MTKPRPAFADHTWVTVLGDSLRGPPPDEDIAMASDHSVSKHLRLNLDQYDTSIRRFIPGYECMIAEAVAAAVAVDPRFVLDLGCGTGALSVSLLRTCDRCVIELWDVDPGMLELARERLCVHARVRLRERSFVAPFPSCDAIMASLALHHIRTLEEKTELYHRAFAALRPGGVLVNADITMPTDEDAAVAVRQAWTGHLMASGIPALDVPGHFAAWAPEDRYFSAEEEVAALHSAGFEARIVWQDGPATVLEARRP